MSFPSFRACPDGGNAAFTQFRATEADLHTYRRLTLSLGVPPNSAMLRYAGNQAAHLVFIGESGQPDWARFLREFYRRWPTLPPGGPVAADGTVLASLPERAAYEQLRPLLSRDLSLDLHQPISPDRGDQRADMTVRRGADAAYIEVVGACGSDLVVRNSQEKAWLDRLHRRLAFYRAQGITPLCVFLDTLMDPAALRQVFHDAIMTLGGKEGRA